MNTITQLTNTNPFLFLKNNVMFVIKVIEYILSKAFDLLELLITKTYKILIFLIWMLVILLIYWSFFDNKSPITYMHYDNASFYTPNDSKVNNGIRYTKHYCFARNTDLRVLPTLTNDIIYNIPNRGPLFYPKGCSKEDIFLEVPTEFPNGVYEYHAHYEIVQNPIKNIEQSFDVFTLTIIDAKHCIYKVSFAN